MERFDVVVVGGGGSGLSAAASAAALGARVLVLEKGAQLGGSTSCSVGSFTAAGTPHQARAGITDHTDALFEDIGKFNEQRAPGVPDNLALRRVLVDHAADTLVWLTNLGVEFMGPMPEPPHRVSRMHNVMPNSRAYAHFLARECRRRGVTIRNGARVKDLLMSGLDAQGVVVETAGGTQEVWATKGVILASGDFSASAALKARFLPAAYTHTAPINPLATGDGLSMAEAHGAKIVNGDYISRSVRIRFVPPEKENFVARLPPNRTLARLMTYGLDHLPARLTRPFVMQFITTSLAPDQQIFEAGGALINSEGELVPKVPGENPHARLAKQNRNLGYIIIDDAMARRFESWPHFISTAPGVAYAYFSDYQRSRKDIVHKGASLEELARVIGVPSERFSASITAHNQACSGIEGAQALRQGPFYALGPVRSFISVTEGALVVTTDLRVVGPDEQPFKRLYAAGITGLGGMVLEGHGVHIAWALTSGRLAGRHCVQGAGASRMRIPPRLEGAPERAAGAAIERVVLS